MRENKPMVFTISTDHLTLHTDKSNSDGINKLDKIVFDDMWGVINVVLPEVDIPKVFYYGKPEVLYALLYCMCADYDVELV